MDIFNKIKPEWIEIDTAEFKEGFIEKSIFGELAKYFKIDVKDIKFAGSEEWEGDLDEFYDKLDKIFTGVVKSKSVKDILDLGYQGIISNILIDGSEIIEILEWGYIGFYRK